MMSVTRRTTAVPATTPPVAANANIHMAFSFRSGKDDQVVALDQFGGQLRADRLGDEPPAVRCPVGARARHILVIKEELVDEVTVRAWSPKHGARRNLYGVGRVGDEPVDD